VRTALGNVAIANEILSPSAPVQPTMAIVARAGRCIEHTERETFAGAQYATRASAPLAQVTGRRETKACVVRTP
jgi:hypothetical protein